MADGVDVPRQAHESPDQSVSLSAPSVLERAAAGLRPWLAWIVAVWSLGVVVCSARPALGWYTLRRLRRVGVSPVSAEVMAKLRRVSKQLGLRGAVQLVQSSLARVPMVVGYFRPVILLPVSLVTSIPAAQLEAILAHELAHVQRHDFAVNLLQTLIETLFFYHPAMWWLSHRIRVERENCCDDLAVSVLDNRVEYGRALLALEELRGTTTSLALGVRSGSLLDRIQRLVRRDPAERTVGAVGIVGMGLLALVILAVGVWNSTLAEKPHSPADAAVAERRGVGRARCIERHRQWRRGNPPDFETPAPKPGTDEVPGGRAPRSTKANGAARAGCGLLECAGRCLAAHWTTDVGPGTAIRGQ